MKLRTTQPELRGRPEAADVAVAYEEQSDSDPCMEISDVDWQSMKEMLDINRSSRDWRNFTAIAFRMLTLFPERKGELGLDDEAFQSIRDSMDLAYDSEEWVYINLAMNLVFLFPERRDKIGLDRFTFNKVKKKMESYRGGDWWSFLYIAAPLTVCYLGCREELQLDEEVFQGIKAEMDEWRTKKNWWRVGDFAMHLSILFPEKKSEISIEPDEVRAMQEQVSAYKREGMWNYIKSAVDYRVLVADEVRVSPEQGIELINRGPIKQTPGLPTRNLTV